MGRIKRCLLKERRNWLKARESFHCRDSINPSWSKNSSPFLIGYQLIIEESAGKVLPEWRTLLLHLRFSSSLHRCLPYRPHARESGRFWLAPDCSGNEEIEREFFVSHERGKKKNKSKGIERQTFGIHTPMLYQWAIEKLMVRWAVTSFIRHTRSTICLD